MLNKTAGILLIIVGVILALFALLADAVGVGGSAGIGWKQLVVVGAGIVLVLIGLWFTARKAKQTKQ